MARIQFRRGAANFWASENPTLHEGEPGVETDTGRHKIGDGRTPWRDLPYASGQGPQGPTGPPGPPGNEGTASQEALISHVASQSPHPVYDDGPSLYLLYQNAKV